MAISARSADLLGYAVSDKTAATEILTEIGTSESATALAADLASAATGKGASLVAIEDAGTLFTATTVEAALAEVKAIADEVEGRVAVNVPLIDTPSGDAETTCNALITALVNAGIIAAP